jgi:serine phosphatase RsbU (regulator of sigma subunit)/anti-sigma regulatory factor (Ser/Thr protein kinase)
MDKLTLPAVLGSLAELRRYARDAAAGAGISEDRSYQLQLAVDEIATNIISYGYKDAGPTAQIVIGGEIRDDALVVTLEDRAPAFDPRSRQMPSAEQLAKPLEERDIGGLGIYFAIEGVDRFDYRREGERNLNIFEVRRDRRGAAEPDGPTPALARTATASWRPAMKPKSIKAKILLALLAVSLLPLFLFVVISRVGMVEVGDRVKTALIGDAQERLEQLAEDQAVIADAMLSQIDAETRLVAHSIGILLAGHGRADPVAGTTEGPLAGLSYSLPPAISFAAARPELARYGVLNRNGALEQVFTLVREGDSKLSAIYFGTASGILLSHPKIVEKQGSLEFVLDAAVAARLTSGTISRPLWEAFQQNQVTLSPKSGVSPLAPGKWLIKDSESERIFSARKAARGFEVYREYDPRIRSWYLHAAKREGVIWTRYADWNSPGHRLFSLYAEQVPDAGGTVSPGLVQAFASRHIALGEASTITLQKQGKWRLQDANGRNYEIREEQGKLTVYNIDILTCTLAVPTPDGKLAGVVGLDVPMSVISGRILHTPEMTSGYAFLLNEQGELIEQERHDMFIPEAGSGIRRKMNAGGSGFEFDAGSASYVFYAPIRSIHSADGKTFWSVGISMSQAEITRLADDIQRFMALVLNVLMVILAAMLLVVIYAATRVSRGITGPILELDAGAMRIGSGDLDHTLQVKTGDEIEELANTFNKMTGDLKTYIRNLKETTAEKERFASELRVAHEIQMSFLKKVFPPFPQRQDFSIFATLEPAREVGGDLYDFTLVDEDRLIFYIGDVSDKGVPASLVMAMTMTLMKRASQQTGMTPAGILRQVNNALAEDNQNAMFVTLFIGSLNLKTGELCFSNAGHNPPLILGADGSCRYLQLPEGLVLGVITDSPYSDDSLQLEAGDMIVTYTDGVTEAMNAQRALYSEERLQETLASLAGRSVEETVSGIVASVRQYADGAPQSDDIAALAVRRN